MRTGLDQTLSSALSGLQVGVDRARSAAGEVARLTTGSETVRDTVKPLLELQKSEQEVSVATKIIKAQDENLGRFVDETV